MAPTDNKTTTPQSTRDVRNTTTPNTSNRITFFGGVRQYEFSRNYELRY